MCDLKPKRVILDKSFLQAENSNGHRLRLLRDFGALFVLPDTLIYEFCTDTNSAQWPAAQRKLFHIADNIEACWHTSELLKQEIAHQKPVKSPINQEISKGIREWFQNGEVYVPANLKEIGEAAKQQREIDTVAALENLCRAFCEESPELTTKFQQGEAGEEACLHDMEQWEELVQWRIKDYHGNPEVKDLYICGAENGLGPEWFAYHNARSSLALCCHFMSKYGLHNNPGRDFVQTKLDSEYLVLLHYSDALATNETRGSLASIHKCIYGDSKTIFSTASLEPFLKRKRGEQDHGHGQQDSFSAEQLLFWEKLKRGSLSTP